MAQHKDRVVLAYSGGLDTSVAIGWIGEQTGMEVVTVAVDLGQGGEDLETVRQRALDCGAVEAYVADAREEFASDYCMPQLQTGGLYMDAYPLISAVSRPVIVKHPLSTFSSDQTLISIFRQFTQANPVKSSITGLFTFLA